MSRPANPGAHEALLEAARAEFAKRGLERARVEDIARRARVSKGAFYLHFRTKEDAFREILQRFLGALEENACRRREAELRLEREARPGDDAVARRLEFECAVDVELLEVLWRNRQMLAVLDSANVRAHARMVGDFRRRLREIVTARITERQRAGQIRRDLDPTVIGDVLLGAYEAFGRRMIDAPKKPDLAAWARAFLLVVYAGILDPSAARGARSAVR